MTKDEIVYFINLYFEEKGFPEKTFENSSEAEKDCWLIHYKDNTLDSLLKAQKLSPYNIAFFDTQKLAQAPVPKSQKKVVVINA